MIKFSWTKSPCLRNLKACKHLKICQSNIISKYLVFWNIRNDDLWSCQITNSKAHSKAWHKAHTDEAWPLRKLTRMLVETILNKMMHQFILISLGKCYFMNLQKNPCSWPNFICKRGHHDQIKKTWMTMYLQVHEMTRRVKILTPFRELELHDHVNFKFGTKWPNFHAHVGHDHEKTSRRNHWRIVQNDFFA